MKKIVYITKHYVLPSILLLALVFSVVTNFILLAKVDELSWRVGMQEIEDVGNTSVEDQLQQLRRDYLSTYFVLRSMVRNDFVNIANQYNLNQYSTCSDVEMRLGDSYFNMLRLSTATDDEAKEDEFKEFIDGLIAVNDESDHLVRSWEHIEYCLLNQ